MLGMWVEGGGGARGSLALTGEIQKLGDKVRHHLLAFGAGVCSSSPPCISSAAFEMHILPSIPLCVAAGRQRLLLGGGGFGSRSMRRGVGRHSTQNWKIVPMHFIVTFGISEGVGLACVFHHTSCVSAFRLQQRGVRALAPARDIPVYHIELRVRSVCAHATAS